MAGPVHKYKYHTDTGTIVAVPMPDWQQALAGGTLADGTELGIAGKLRPRYRMIQNTATGREKKVKVMQITSTFWTEAMNTPHTAVDDGTTNGIPNAISGGRIGERVLNR